MRKDFDRTRKRCFEKLNALQSELKELADVQFLTEPQRIDKIIKEAQTKLLLYVLHGEL